MYHKKKVNFKQITENLIFYLKYSECQNISNIICILLIIIIIVTKFSYCYLQPIICVKLSCQEKKKFLNKVVFNN